MQAISQEPVTQLSQSLLQQACIYLLQGLALSNFMISLHILFLQTPHQGMGFEAKFVEMEYVKKS